MDQRRLDLQALLESILGTAAVYFQRPPHDDMEYPCIVYGRDQAAVDYADDTPYHRTKRYQVTVIDRDPDSEIPDKIAMLKLCTHSRSFPANNLNHDVFNLYY